MGNQGDTRPAPRGSLIALVVLHSITQCIVPKTANHPPEAGRDALVTILLNWYKISIKMLQGTRSK